MKDQYRGDVNDYLKYGLLRCFSDAGWQIGISWMVTPSDGRNDGAKTGYLRSPTVWRQHDAVLFDALRRLVFGDRPRSTASIEDAELVPGARYFSETVPEDRHGRDVWFARALLKLLGSDLLFFDPDNGFEVGSAAKGLRGSSKYVYWDEIATAWRSGSSLLVFQHFAREERVSHIERLMVMMAEHTPESIVKTWRSPHVVFLLACQRRHASMATAAIQMAESRWESRLSLLQLSSTGGLQPRQLPVKLEEAPREKRAWTAYADPPQSPYSSSDAAITDASSHVATELVHRKVVCPSCKTFVFRMWPEGWDAHAAFRCAGLNAVSRDDRKREYKALFGHLFRSG